MNNFLLKVRPRPAGIYTLLAALAIAVALFECGRASAQNVSGDLTGVASAHDVVSFSDLAAANAPTAAPSAEPIRFRNNKRALPGVTHKPSHGITRPLRTTQSTPSTTLSSTASTSSSTLKTMSLA